MLSSNFEKVPVKINEVLEVQVDSLGKKGDPLTHIKGYTIFIKHAGLQARDKVRVRISKVFQKFAFAELVQVLDAQEQTV